MSAIPYETFVLRNAGYVPPAVQQRLAGLRILIAGCGMGSVLAEVLLRLGVLHLHLVDGDVVEGHNLNRQDFAATDLGRAKVDALRERLLAINPAATIVAVRGLVTPDNAAALVAGCDLVVDTIDFLALEGVIALHDAARAQGRPVLSALNIGFGGGVIYLPAGGPCTARQLFGLPETGPVDGYSYVACYSALVQRIGAHLDPQVARVLASAMHVLADGRPCPAPQVAAGSYAMAAMAGTVVVRLLAGDPVPAAPRMMLLSLNEIVTGHGCELGRGA
ncbi:MAG: ThiF family adenylyltransferase [Planctomycetes bacterium]|nr:ThiF family adenylyltransferase [Planctomycetota bacterium]